MKKGIFAIVVCCLMTLGGPGLAAPGPMDVLKSSVIRLAEGVPDREAARILDRTLEYDTIGLEVLGDSASGLTEEQVAEFHHVFSELLRRSYVKNISGLKGARVEWVDEIYVPKLDAAKVKVRAVRGGETVDMSFWMIHKFDRWCVSDVEVEGVSMVDTWRSQVRKIIKRDGFSGLISKLRAKLAKG